MSIALRMFKQSLELVPKKSATIWLWKRNTTNDFARDKSGNREVVGYGYNGSPNYCDRFDYPMPAIRFREPTIEICKLREKERGDWRKLTMDEKKILYRYSFCHTFQEMKAPTGDWKLNVAFLFWALAIGFPVSLIYGLFLYGPLPVTFDEEHRQAQFKRIIDIEVNPITGIASKWDYENMDWKK
ncbi:cytochrome c oxidase subunit 4 isoform 1, mitochondrial-like [Teleopsis dalmanni]|uniref:cytochrome c oxidase subunit 4 isoform 1, mitochondrial-like n=1 Tax=Teleopsis dalmanni TaxID=139649 RepID=UPI0018CDD46C|nr:cytochrome c oxidase subunit 4 isoform 1, mitochondrial-like [Teleopsis dalmanni]